MRKDSKALMVSDKGNGRSGVTLLTRVEHLSRRLSQVHDSLMKVKRVVEENKTDVFVRRE